MPTAKDITTNNQIERYLSQVIRAFRGFTVKDGVQRNGEDHVENVPVLFGTPSRIVAAIMSSHESFRNVKLPLMAVNMTGLALDEESTLNRYHEGEVGFKRKDGETEIIRRLTGPALRMEITLSIYASSVSQLMELFEKIMLTFNTEVKIQKGNDIRDQDYITAIKLESVQSEIESPLGERTRSARMAMNFTVPIRLSYPVLLGEAIDQIVLDVKTADTEPETTIIELGEVPEDEA